MTDEGSTDPAFDAMLALVRSRTGLVFPPARRHFAGTAVRRALARSGTMSTAALAGRLATEPGAFDALVADLTVGETYFFRDVALFDLIRRVVLPETRARLGPDHVFRAWSAGCASGEEAYSLAILLDQEGAGERSLVVGSDISAPLLGKARAGIYTAWSLRGPGRALAEPYLVRRRQTYTVAARLCRRVAFERINLLADRYPSDPPGAGMDLVLCRNVLIYFDQDAIGRVAERLLGALAEGGRLITGPADPIMPGGAGIDIISTEAGLVYHRLSGPRSVTVSRRDGDDEAVAVARRRPGPIGRRVAAPVPPTRPAAPRPPIATPVSAGAAPEPGLQARSLAASGDVAGAEALAAAAASRQPLLPELHFLQAMLLVELGRYEDAEKAVRRVIYLDPGLGFGHLTLGIILQRRGRLPEARLAYRNGRALLSRLPADAPVRLSDGELAGSLLSAAETCLAAIDGAR